MFLLCITCLENGVQQVERKIFLVAVDLNHSQYELVDSKRALLNLIDSLVLKINEGKEKQLSKKTISLELHKLGFWARRPNKKPLLSKRNLIKRLAFQKLYNNWGSNNWKNNIFRRVEVPIILL